MARFRRLETLQTIGSSGLVPIFYNSDVEVAVNVAEAVHRGGSRILEFTNRGEEATTVFRELVARCRKNLPDLILGIGTVSDPATAALYLGLGADFIVSPVLCPDVIRVANRRKIPVLPGCGSATEIASAEELGCEIIKVFPADALGGPNFIRAILGPSPWSSLMPTGGVSPSNLAEFLSLPSVLACGGSWLTPADAVAAGNYDEITRLAAEAVAIAKKVRG